MRAGIAFVSRPHILGSRCFLLQFKLQGKEKSNSRYSAKLNEDENSFTIDDMIEVFSKLAVQENEKEESETINETIAEPSKGYLRKRRNAIWEERVAERKGLLKVLNEYIVVKNRSEILI